MQFGVQFVEHCPWCVQCSPNLCTSLSPSSLTMSVVRYLFLFSFDLSMWYITLLSFSEVELSFFIPWISTTYPDDFFISAHCYNQLANISYVIFISIHK